MAFSTIYFRFASMEIRCNDRMTIAESPSISKHQPDSNFKENFIKYRSEMNVDVQQNCHQCSSHQELGSRSKHVYGNGEG